MTIDSKPSNTPPVVLPAQDGGWIMKYLKGNPLKALAGVLALCGILITSVWAADERFNQMPQIGQIQRQMIYDKNQRLEDQIFVLEMQAADGTATNVEKALLERYKSRLATQK